MMHINGFNKKANINSIIFHKQTFYKSASYVNDQYLYSERFHSSFSSEQRTLFEFQ